MLPDCSREDCLIQYLGGSSTLMSWTPTYDKDGNQVNQDPNTHTKAYRCTICSKQWCTKTRLGVVTLI